jgi:hypothetical protein
MTFDLAEELENLDRVQVASTWLSRIDLDPEKTLRAQQGVAFSALVRLDGKPICRVEQRGDDKPSLWRTTGKGPKWSDVVTFRDQLEEAARTYFHVESDRADVVVAALVTGATNGAQAALRWRTLEEGRYVSSESCLVRSWPQRRAQARYQRHRWTCEACTWGNGDNCPEAAFLHAEWAQIEPDPQAE